MYLKGPAKVIYTPPLSQFSVAADRALLADQLNKSDMIVVENPVCYNEVQEVVSMNFEKVSDNIRYQNTFLDLLYLIYPLSLPQYDTALTPFTF